MADAIFTDGMIIKPPRDGAPDFVKCSISIRSDEFIRWLENHTSGDGWCNIDVKVGKSGKWYGQKNSYQKPAAVTRIDSEDDVASSIPF